MKLTGPKLVPNPNVTSFGTITVPESVPRILVLCVKLTQIPRFVNDFLTLTECSEDLLRVVSVSLKRYVNPS